MLAAIEAQGQLGLPGFFSELADVDVVEPQLGKFLIGEGHARRLGDPAPAVGVAPEQRRLDQGRVGDRACRFLGLLRARGLPHFGAADARRALTVGGDLQREL